MTLKEYLKDQIIPIIFFIFMLLIISLMLSAFKATSAFIVAILLIIILFQATIFSYQFYRKNVFYHKLLDSLSELDQKYLVTELIEVPTFLEGKIFYQVLYEVDKSMKEHINCYQDSMGDFKDYIEMWIHEVKIPLANVILALHNQKELITPNIQEQLKRLEDDVDQVLYYVRAENSEKDYLIKSCHLKKIVHEVILRNKDSLIYKNVNITTKNLDYAVLTDSKWLAFIINQIINNSIKYQCKKDAQISITASKEKDQVILQIHDNGIGISPTDLPQVFNKSFTGFNGRMSSQATGMGLYICQNLCKKLGHKIMINSEEGKFTEVSIIFTENNFYDVIK